MAKVKEKTPLSKSNGWISSFNLLGEARITKFTYKIDEHSQKSDWVYNQLNLGIDCGSKHGTIYTELMGGYGSERNNNVIYAHGKNEDGTDDFKNQIIISWEDREDPDVIDTVGEMCFIRAALERDTKGNPVESKFLTPYDAINYISEHLEDGMIVSVRGNLRYTIYNGSVQCRKEITSIRLLRDESNITPDNYHANFIQTMLLDKDSATKDNIDKEKKTLNVYAYVLEKFKEYNGWDLTEGGKIKGGIFVPLRRTFEFVLPEDPKSIATILSSPLMFKVKKDISQVTFEGDFIETGAAVETSVDDLTDDIKALIEMGIYTEESVLDKAATNGSKERRMILTAPYLKNMGDEDNKRLTIQRFDEVYTEEDLQLDCLIPKESDEDEDDGVPFDEAMDAIEENEESDELADLLAALS